MRAEVTHSLEYGATVTDIASDIFDNNVSASLWSLSEKESMLSRPISGQQQSVATTY
jgi:hypothetical protein